MDYTVPYNWQPNKWQEEVLNCKSRYKVILWHRRGRKTTLLLNELLRRAIHQKGIYLYCAPFYSQAKKIIWDDPAMLQNFLPPQGFQLNHSNLTIKTPNGSLIYITGADNPDSLRGINPIGICMDEMDDIKIELWLNIFRPILAENGGWAIFAGTPRGMGNLYQLFHKADTDPEWASFRLKASESGLFKPEELESAKRDMPQAIYDQEFETAFLESGTGVFRRIEENVLDLPFHLEPNRQYKLGVDLAKFNDFTVITPIDLHTWQVGPPVRFNQIDYPLQEAKIEAEWLRHNKAEIEIDSTGVGEPVCDHLERKGLTLTRFTFTETSRMQLLQNLALVLEQDRIKLPKYDKLLEELRAVRYELSENRKLKITSPMTDDCVMSLALAVDNLIFKKPAPISEEWQEFYKYRKQARVMSEEFI